ncbi:helix-turn-helix domain-containing protein [Jiella sp. M17.18]|uniref:helix-turn-helix domain-containing protein n=1 Tax=Jiella sp. M17.18 TaxID=3234247 RepID=UPI0034DFAE55
MIQPTYSPEEFKEAQRRLGLSDAEFAFVLGIENPQHVRRLKIGADKPSHRPVQPATARLLRAYLEDGYRPTDWPKT